MRHLRRPGARELNASRIGQRESGKKRREYLLQKYLKQRLPIVISNDDAAVAHGALARDDFLSACYRCICSLCEIAQFGSFVVEDDHSSALDVDVVAWHAEKSPNKAWS